MTENATGDGRLSPMENRISRQQLFMDVAEVFAKRSTCFRGNVGAVIIAGSNIIAAGYNGAQAGHPHCAGSSCELNAVGGCRRSVHAEINALRRIPHSHRFSAGDREPYLDLYTTAAPCPDCALAITENLVIRRVFYRHPYRDEKGVNFLHNRTEVYRVTPSGSVVDHFTRAIINPESLR
jgi:dCMP deaminase